MFEPHRAGTHLIIALRPNYIKLAGNGSFWNDEHNYCWVHISHMADWIERGVYVWARDGKQIYPEVKENNE